MSEYLRLKTGDCKSCYKCIRHCPVKSIRFEDNHADIISDECVLCGHCFVHCPQNAKEIRDDLSKAEKLLLGKEPVYASIAPSFIARYEGVPISILSEALKKIGFKGVEETAIGATIVKKEYDRLVTDEFNDIIISSCCHTVNELIAKYYPELLPCLAPVLSPMLAHGMDIKARFAQAKIVFIGPCISKKEEADKYGNYIDCVLTFDELDALIEKRKIDLDKETKEKANNQSLARNFPIPGGILKTMVKENPSYTYMEVDGITNCIRALDDIREGQTESNACKCFVEMSACEGSCICGPVLEKHPLKNYVLVSAYAGKKDFTIKEYLRETLEKRMVFRRVNRPRFGEKTILETLAKIGKTKKEHELNCGCCGYSTCREKAQAVLEEKATLTMCLPYLTAKAESFSDTIINNTPNAIIVLNENLLVQQINQAACKMMKIKPEDILHDQVIRILDPAPFLEVCDTGNNIFNSKTYIADYDRYVEESVLYDKEYHILICILRDISDIETTRKSREQFNKKTIALANEVIEKQMRTVQEIASLLGETAAETKVALSSLKESLSHDE
jgi:iron only hydrogenase large subunit-like protein